MRVFECPLNAIQTPTIAWNRIGKKINTHSTTGRNGIEWMAKTAFWKTSGPPLKLAFVSRWTHMYAPTGINPLSEWSRRIKKSCFLRKDRDGPAGLDGDDSVEVIL